MVTGCIGVMDQKWRAPRFHVNYTLIYLKIIGLLRTTLDLNLSEILGKYIFIKRDFFSVVQVLIFEKSSII